MKRFSFFCKKVEEEKNIRPSSQSWRHEESPNFKSPNEKIQVAQMPNLYDKCIYLYAQIYININLYK